MENTQKQIKPEDQKILDYVIPKQKINREYLPDEIKEKESIVLGDLIDIKIDIDFDKKSGKPILKHSGVLDIWDKIGVETLEPTLQKTGDMEYQVVQGLKFADGRIFYGTGETSIRNVDAKELSGKFPVNQAHIRAFNKAMVRGLGLYRVLWTEEEADEFKQPIVQKVRQEVTQELTAKFQQQVNQFRMDIKKQQDQKEKEVTKVLDNAMKHMILPSTDDRYPGEPLLDIWKVHHDIDYLEQLAKSEDFGYFAKRMLQVIEIREAQEKQVQHPSDKEQVINLDEEGIEDETETSAESHSESPETEDEVKENEEEMKKLQEELKAAEEEMAATVSSIKKKDKLTKSVVPIGQMAFELSEERVVLKKKQ